MKNVTTRMTEDELDLIDRLTTVQDGSRSESIRRAIRRGAREELIRIALQRYQKGEIGMRGAAELAGVTLSEILREANERGVLSNYDETDLSHDVAALR